MKATKGMKITCSLCGQEVGRFERDVDSNSPIVQEDVSMDGGLATPELSYMRWSCKNDSVVVAESFVKNWRVHTSRGWIQ
jgi:hypothetical protein